MDTPPMNARCEASHEAATRRRSLRRGVLSLLCSALLLPPVALAQEHLYVQSLQAGLLAEPRADAPAVSTLGRGTKVQLLESKAGWRKVRLDEKSGWIFGYFLAEHPPLERVSPAVTETVDRQHVRRRASAVVTAGATRGLSPEERARAHVAGISDYGALEAMERLAVTEAQLQTFVQAGIPK